MAVQTYNLIGRALKEGANIQTMQTAVQRQTKSQTRYTAAFELSAEKQQPSAEGSADSRQKKHSDTGMRKESSSQQRK